MSLIKEKRTGIIRIQATTPKLMIAPVYYCPEMNDAGGFVDGLDKIELTKEEREKIRKAIAFTDETSVRVKHLDKLDLSNDKQFGIYVFLKYEIDEIATTKSVAIPAKHRFYIEDKEAESKIILTTGKSKFKALGVANDIILAAEKDESQLYDACRLLNVFVKGMTISELAGALMQEADKNSDRFLSQLSDTYRNSKIFVLKLIESGKLKKHTTGSYHVPYGNQDMIAVNDLAMYEYVQDKKNLNQIRIWSNELNDNRLLEESEETISGDLTAPQAIATIRKFTSKENLLAFIKGDDRQSVISAGNKKLEELTKGKDQDQEEEDVE